MNILGLIGPAGCGKDTVAGILAKYGYERIASADTMKEDAMRYFDIQPVELERYKNDKLNISYVNEFDETFNVGKFSIRQFLQVYGMDMRYRFGDDYWIDRSVNSKISERGEDAKIVITDVRFQNEIDYIKSRNGSVAFISGRSKLTGKHKKHISEALANSEEIQKQVDFIIDNSDTLKNLEAQLTMFRDMKVIG